jgi:tRNA (adenine22-N1)-methyltransferase
MEKYKIADLRLAAAASFGRKGKMVADIGTDHASLPIFLVGNGIADSALACDINIGPLNAAKKNIEAAGLADKINTKLTDGLNGIEDFNPEDIYHAGDASPNIVGMYDPRPNGKPYYRPEYYKGSTEFFINCTISVTRSIN